MAILRWALLLPGTFLVAWGAYFVAALFNRCSFTIMGVALDSFFFKNIY